MSKLQKPVKDLVLDNIVGTFHWHGETYADDESYDNQEAAYELVLALIAGIQDNATLASNAVATASGNRLNERAKDMLKNIKEDCDLEFTL